MKTTKISNYVSVGFIFLFWIAAFQNFFANLGHISNIQLNESVIIQLAISNSLITIVFVSIFLALANERPHDIGFRSNKLPVQLLIGSSIGLILALVDHIAIGNFIKMLLPEKFDEGMRILGEFINKINIWIWLALTIFIGGFIEELQRIFIITRFERCFGMYGIVFALIVESLLQGAGHAYQGPERAIIYIFVGLIFGLVYLRKRSAIEAMACHAVYDVFGLLWFTFHLK